MARSACRMFGRNGESEPEAFSRSCSYELLRFWSAQHTLFATLGLGSCEGEEEKKRGVADVSRGRRIP